MLHKRSLFLSRKIEPPTQKRGMNVYNLGGRVSMVYASQANLTTGVRLLSKTILFSMINL